MDAVTLISELTREIESLRTSISILEDQCECLHKEIDELSQENDELADAVAEAQWWARVLYRLVKDWMAAARSAGNSVCGDADIEGMWRVYAPREIVAMYDETRKVLGLK